MQLRQAMATVLAELWVEVDLALPYSAGELLARVRERGTVEFEYRDEDVRIQGRVPPSLVADLRRAAACVGACPEGPGGRRLEVQVRRLYGGRYESGTLLQVLKREHFHR